MNYLIEKKIITSSGRVNNNYRHMLTEEIMGYLVTKTPHLDTYSEPIERIFNIINNLTEIKKCESCGNKVKFSREYKRYCSRKCANSNLEVKDKRVHIRSR